MKLIIDIPEEEYKRGILSEYFGCWSMKLHDTILNGTPLPKHGRLIDADDLYENTEICHSDIDGYACVRWKDINDAPTIIEAESEDEE